ncbi:membrane protein DedA, SNARE-associated domain [Thiohalospira halophila DSM 15071]|uniref:Membrane protein DedA, SNARE-associated domain n=1 Tax=Thiohalospira halophila DSM 15071 TaxID=1123397 RepID=A0A1I1Q7Y8_9GAMM|nr:DedA family protein [Thiohalospira halophila]SFD18276.1 membrane protein DedA, SNARE-associated domain [Thiohalospira halophila DSM 15071]
MTLDGLVAEYGYLAIAAGVFIEGEVVVATGGVFAARGVLGLPQVILSAFLGSVLTYQIFFLLGRSPAARWLADRPRWQHRVMALRQRLVHHHVGLILTYRLLFGLRNATPFVLGLSGVPWWRFTLLDLVPAAIWSVAVSLVGYVLGRELLRWTAENWRAELVMTGVAVALLVAAIWWLRRRLHRRDRTGDSC